MGIKLSPPLLEGTIPAFYSNGQGIVITIPFSMNRVVSWADVKGFQVQIKKVQSGTIIDSFFVEKSLNQNNSIELFISDENQLQFNIGQYYKFQVAYVNDGTVGYYSTVAIGKYTAKPDVKIGGLERNNLNSHTYSYTGLYLQCGENNPDKKYDITEKVYTYKFNLYDSEGNLIDTSGDLLHNTSNDTENNQSQDTYTFSQDLPLGKAYRVEYCVTTNNGLTISSPKYRITQKQSISPEINASLSAKLNYDNGYISIDLHALKADELSTGFFILSRSSEDSNYTTWDEVHRFDLVAEIANKHLCKDFTIEQGKNYIYAIQQYNKNNLFSNRIKSNIVYADFEDAFLYDGKRQLKIKYNPKISSFKKNLLEQKTDTIGGKHPFIFRNGRVNYSEFPISGLISYQMDEENLFLSEDEYGLTEKTTNLTGDNFAAERVFKMKALEWLTNGEAKVFRSPAEGNFIVRLMNSSLSPNDTVGRMLHTFSSTAYEVADFNYSALGDMGFININIKPEPSLQWETIEFKNVDSTTNLLSPTPGTVRLAKTVRFDNMMPGDVVSVVFVDNTQEDIKIGVTSSYYIDTGISIKEIKFKTPFNNRPLTYGSMTYSYDYTKEPAFNFINSVEIQEMPVQQFIGEHDILKELLYVKDGENWVKNPKLQLTEVYHLSAQKRPLQRTVKKEDNPINYDSLSDPFLVYEIGVQEIVAEGYPQNRPNVIFTPTNYYDGYSESSYDKYEPLILFNGANISVNEKDYVEYTKPGEISELKSGNGVLVNIGYQMANITYNVENEALRICSMENPDKTHYLYSLGQKIKNYNTTIENFNSAIDNEDIATIDNCRSVMNGQYVEYILELVKAQEEDLRRRGELINE